MYETFENSLPFELALPNSLKVLTIILVIAFKT